MSSHCDRLRRYALSGPAFVFLPLMMAFGAHLTHLQADRWIIQTFIAFYPLSTVVGIAGSIIGRRGGHYRAWCLSGLLVGFISLGTYLSALPMLLIRPS